MPWGPSDAREALAGLLSPAIAPARVVPYADDVAPEPEHPVAVCYVESVGPGSQQVTAALLWRMEVRLAVARTEPGRADDELDALLGTVLAALDGSDVFLWTVATRSVYLESFPCYVVSVEVQK